MSVKKNLIDQKEYLKKYLSGDKKKKKKDKKHKKHESRLKIIDDNLFAHEVNDIDEELLLTGEDAPQIVGDVIEVQPDTTVAPKWRNIAVKEEPVDENEESKYKPDHADLWGVKKENTKIKDEFSPRKRKIKKEPADSQTDGNGARAVDSDLSPPPHRQRNNSDSDLSLPRRRRRSEDSDMSLPRRRRRRSASKEKLESRSRRKERSDDSDLSLPRRRRRKGSADSDLSLPRRRRSEKNSREDVESSLSKRGRRRSGSADSDMSLPRRRRSEKNSREDVDSSLSRKGRKRAGSADSDMSLPRRRGSEKNSRDDVDSSLSKRGRRKAGSEDSDMSLPRRRRQDRNDHSPRGSRNRRKSEDSDISLPRRRIESSVSKSSRERSSKRRPVQNPEFINSDNDSDLDVRRNRRSRDVSTTRVKVKREILSPEICRSDEETTTINNPNVHIKEEKLTPPRKKQSRWNRTDDNPGRSPTKNPFKRKSASPPATHRGKHTDKHKSSPQRNRNERKSSSPPPTHKGKISKTLDGKKAGLQDAQALKLENEKRRREEERLFEEMSKDVSGRDAEIAVRKSGRKGRRGREAEEEDPEERMRREQREKEKKEIYDRWGKGVKQVEDYRQRLEEDAYEASKPLARYSNDEDLDRYLREQEHAEDPMLQYMREKKRKKAKEDNVPVIPKYEGSFPENRYGIRPGYRWDGVDRSNGYEKRWFEVRNERRAREEEAYKYSVEDM